MKAGEVMDSAVGGAWKLLLKLFQTFYVSFFSQV